MSASYLSSWARAIDPQPEAMEVARKDSVQESNRAEEAAAVAEIFKFKDLLQKMLESGQPWVADSNGHTEPAVDNGHTEWAGGSDAWISQDFVLS